MAQDGQFVIRNEFFRPLALYIEPEGAFFPFEKGEQVSVFDVFTTAPVTIKFTNTDQGEPILSIWPGDGEVRVEKNGVDLLDLLQKGVGV
jgi:hypothetical protein